MCVSLSPACEIVTVAAVIAFLVGAAGVEACANIAGLLEFAVVIAVLVGAAVIEICSGTAIVEACSVIPGLLEVAVVITVRVGTAAVENCSAIPGLLGSYSKRQEAFHLISTPSAVIVAPDAVVTHQRWYGTTDQLLGKWSAGSILINSCRNLVSYEPKTASAPSF